MDKKIDLNLTSAEDQTAYRTMAYRLGKTPDQVDGELELAKKINAVEEAQSIAAAAKAQDKAKTLQEIKDWASAYANRSQPASTAASPNTDPFSTQAPYPVKERP